MLLCTMPEVILPDELYLELEDSETGVIDSTEGPGVAAYISADGRTRAVIYVGLELDGVDLYRNLSHFDPGIKMQFALEPIVLCPTDVIYLSTGHDSTIAIQVASYTDLYSYTVLLGGVVVRALDLPLHPIRDLRRLSPKTQNSPDKQNNLCITDRNCC